MSSCSICPGFSADSMAPRKKHSDKIHRSEIGLWTMVRDVLVASINRGQLPQATTALVLIVIVVRMPTEDVSKLVFGILDGLSDWSLLGWIVGGIAILLWWWHAKSQRRRWSTEMNRVSRERTKYQERALREELGSSEE